MDTSELQNAIKNSMGRFTGNLGGAASITGNFQDRQVEDMKLFSLKRCKQSMEKGRLEEKYMTLSKDIIYV